MRSTTRSSKSLTPSDLVSRSTEAVEGTAHALTAALWWSTGGEVTQVRDALIAADPGVPFTTSWRRGSAGCAGCT